MVSDVHTLDERWQKIWNEIGSDTPNLRPFRIAANQVGAVLEPIGSCVPELQDTWWDHIRSQVPAYPQFVTDWDRFRRAVDQFGWGWRATDLDYDTGPETDVSGDQYARAGTGGEWSAMRLGPQPLLGKWTRVDTDDPHGLISQWEPKFAHPGDVGIDLLCTIDYTITPGQVADLPAGVAVQLPPGHWGYLVGRSSTPRKWGLHVHPGVIDNGYRGPLFCAVSTIRPNPVTVKRGTRLGQLLILPMAQPHIWTWAEQLDDSSRGTDGFGSTGR